MKKILITLLIILISSCKTFPEIKQPITRCGIFIERLGENTYSGKCRCHEYVIHFQSGTFKRISESTDHSLDKCSNYVALAPVDWGILRSEFDQINLWLKEVAQKLK